ncbi:MAG TPA: TolC family protein [Candidatus Bathyarchaeia archaeon]|nr:TolC family protein [Candidatus Bathyarchaeia archaeon]
MNRKLIMFVVMYIVLLSVGTSNASPLEPARKTITLKEILAVAREFNGDLQALREERKIGQASRTKAGLFINPTIEFDGATGKLSGAPAENRIGFGLSQEFLTGGKRKRRMAVAEAELIRFEHRMTEAERQIDLEIKTVVSEIRLAEGRFDLAGQSHDLNRRLLYIAQARLAAGEIAELDVNLVKVENAQSEGMMIDAQRELIPAQQRLLALMGRSSLDILKISAPAATGKAMPGLSDLKALALKKRPDLQALVVERIRNDAAVALARADQYPNVQAGISLIREDGITALGRVEERNTDYLVGFKLSIPFPVFDRNRTGIEEALARSSSTALRERHGRQAVEREVEGAYARYMAAEKVRNIYAKTVIPQLTDNLKLVEEAYRLGEIGILTVLAEHKKFVEVNEAYLLAIFNCDVALAKLEAAAGMDFNDQVSAKEK